MQLDRNNRNMDVHQSAILRIIANDTGVLGLTGGSIMRIYGVIRFTYMPQPPQPQTKRQALEASGTFNPRSAKVRHPLFQQSEFFDPQDLLQLKYETLRALKAEGCSIAKAASDFGLSRPRSEEHTSE